MVVARAGHRRPAAADRPARHRRGDQRGQLRHRGRPDRPAAGPLPRRRGRRTATPCSSWRPGSRRWRAQPVALAIILFCALDSAVYGASTVLYVPLSIRLGTGPNGYSYLLAGAALGGVLGAGLANRLSGASRLAPVIMGSICLQALPFLADRPGALARAGLRPAGRLRRRDGHRGRARASPACSATCPGTCSAGCSASSTPWCWAASCWPAWPPASCSRTPTSTSR